MNKSDWYFNWITNNKSVIVVVFFVAAVYFFINNFGIGFYFPITDWHGFRQTQTAISTYYLEKDGFAINYITPVLGPPWSIPFEFPTYQYFVVLFHKWIPFFGLDQCGRIVSRLFYLGVLIVIYKIGREFKFSSNKMIFVMSILLIEPTYLFWSRTFMIETTVLFLSVSFVLFFIKYIHSNNIWFLLLALIFGTIAGLTKLTTFFIYLATISIYFFYYVFVLKNKTSVGDFVLKAIVLIVPVLITIVWVYYTDHLKLQNIQGEFITSKGLIKWNYGTWEQKISFNVWKQILDYSSIPLILVFTSLLFYKLLYWKLNLVLTFLWLLGPLVFTNLYFIHDYYSCANNLLIELSICLFIFSITEIKIVKLKFFMLILVVSFYLCSLVINYNLRYKVWQNTFDIEIRPIGNKLKRQLNPNQSLIIFSGDWDSRIPYYSERKGLLWGFIDIKIDYLKKYQKALKEDEEFGGILVLNKLTAEKQSQVDDLIKYLGYKTIPEIIDLESGNKYYLYQK